MAIRRGSKVDKQGSAASMTDLMFLLLIFLLIATTLIAPNALKLVLPQSSAQQNKADRAVTTVSVTADGHYYVETERVQVSELASALKQRMGDAQKPVVSLHCDKNVPIQTVVEVMDVVRELKYELTLAINPQ